MCSVRSALCLLVFSSGSPLAAQMPSTDIFVADLQIDGPQIDVTAPRNITARRGYDNQPWFTRDGAALLYNADMGGQTDVFRYDLATGTLAQLTRTPENEFSPSLIGDGDELLVVRWPADMSTGALWRYTEAGQPIGPHRASVERVGYYGVIDADRMAVFVNDSARSFVIANGRTGERELITTGIAGSPPQRIPGADAVSFMMPAEDSVVWIHSLELSTGEVRKIAPAVGESTSYAWLPGGVLLMPGGNALYAIDPWAEAEWREVARFDIPALTSIVRIAVNAAADRVALVAEQ